MEHLSHSEQETEQLGEQVARKLPRGTVIAYTGELGMGKTAFTRGLARGLGCRGRVTSPTFTIVNEYEGDIPLFHFDLYRLGSSDELFDIGWEDYLAQLGVESELAPAQLLYQNAVGVGLAAEHGTPVSAQELAPVYLRISQAERERNARLQQESTQK